LNKSFYDKVARIVSNIFVPPSNTLLLFIFLAYLEPDSNIRNNVLLSGILLGFLIPIIFFIFLRKYGKVDDVDAKVKEQRTIPYLFGIFLCSLGVIWMKLVAPNLIYSDIWIVYGINTIIIIIINKYWKISAHALGVASPIAILLFIFGIQAIILLPIIVLVGWARLQLKMHNLAQIIVGTLLGITSSYTILFLLNF